MSNTQKTMKTANNWMCITWEKLPSHDHVAKALTTPEPITEQEALRRFKKKCPNLRNHTVQVR